MSTQRERFQAAWQIKWPNDEPRIFEQDTKGYTWPEVQDTWEGWQLCEASALERAKQTLRDMPHPPEIFGEGAAIWEQAIDAAISALAQEDV